MLTPLLKVFQVEFFVFGIRFFHKCKVYSDDHLVIVVGLSKTRLLFVSIYAPQDVNI